MAETCRAIAESGEFSCDGEDGTFVRAVLLEASTYPSPRSSPEHDAQFDEHPIWGGPAARIDAAAGLTALTGRASCERADLLAAVERLGSDLVPAVRYQVAVRLLSLYRRAQPLMWDLIRKFCHDESSRGVVQGLIAVPLARLVNNHPDDVVSLVKVVYDRITQGPGAKAVREACISVFSGLYLLKDHPQCRDIVFGTSDDPSAFPDENHYVTVKLRNLLTYGPVSPPNPEQDAVRHRAWDLMGRILRSTHAAWLKLQLNEKPPDSWPEAEQQVARNLAQLADAVCMQVYFASGAFEEKRTAAGSDTRVLNTEEKQRFLTEAEQVLDELAEFASAGVTHHLVETLAFLASVDPAGVFLRIGRVVRAGKRGHYEYEPLAAEVMVRLVERYLAEFRGVLRENKACRDTLLEVLDTFVQAGWPSARRLTYRLEEIFR